MANKSRPGSRTKTKASSNGLTEKLIIDRPKSRPCPTVHGNFLTKIAMSFLMPSSEPTGSKLKTGTYTYQDGSSPSQEPIRTSVSYGIFPYAGSLQELSRLTIYMRPVPKPRRQDVIVGRNVHLLCVFGFSETW